MLPKEENYLSTKTELLDQITGLLAGRVAEDIVFHEVTTGAHNDFERATKIARAMVTEYGMSDLGPVQFEHQDSSSVFLGRDYNKSRNFSSQVAFEIDQEQRKIINECYEKTKQIISQNMDLLDTLANALLENETLTKEQIDYIAHHGCLKEHDDDRNSSDVEEENLTNLTVNELKDIAKEKGIEIPTKITKAELIKLLEEAKK